MSIFHVFLINHLITFGFNEKLKSNIFIFSRMQMINYCILCIRVIESLSCCIYTFFCCAVFINVFFLSHSILTQVLIDENCNHTTNSLEIANYYNEI